MKSWHVLLGLFLWSLALLVMDHYFIPIFT